MKKSAINKKVILFFVATVIALCICVCAIFGVSVNTVESDGTLVAGAVNASANGEGGRVTMLDLMGRYPMDYVLGPLGTKATSGSNAGKYVDAKGNVLLDKNDEETNNEYGIPRNMYFDVESYIYTTGVKDSTEGRTLYGWKPNIVGVDPSREGDIGEDGIVMRGDGINSVGIYAKFVGPSQIYGSTCKYALIVPKDITKVGTGSAAFVGKNASGVQTSYYNGRKSVDNNAVDSYTSGDFVAEYTDFASFIFKNMEIYNPPYFWQPRERLAGVYFPEDSRLQTIEGSADDYSTKAETDSNRTSTDDIGKAAFLGCDNLRFLILPGKNESAGTTGLQTIGKNAFFRCNKVVDLNIPSSVTTLGSNAFNGLELLHLTIPNIENASLDAFTECSKLKSIVDIGGKFSGKFSGYVSYVTSKEANPNNVIYIMGGEPTKDDDGKLVNDSGLYGFVFVRNGSNWQALALAGATGEDANRVFVFPNGDDFKEDSDRRTDVKYDYLDCDGERRFSSFAGVSVTQYDIANDFASGTWCQNVVMPKEVTKIGSKAFYMSGVRYLETYATEIGSQAFAGTNNAAVEQWYYFHSTTNNPTYSVASNAFAVAEGSRHVVFENKETWQNVNVTNDLHITHKTNNNYIVQHYLIPIIADVKNEDNDSVVINNDDMKEHFFYDSDYVENPTVAKGEKQITYTKRLSGSNYNFTTVKQYNGKWVVNTAVSNSHKSPALSNMSETVWYDSNTYATSTDASQLFSSTTSTSVVIYTKNIAKPANIANGEYDGVYKGEYTFGEEYTFGANKKTLGDADDQSIDYSTVLGLSDDYSIVLDNFTYAGGSATAKPAKLHDAGSYSFSIKLNPKWGVWSQKYIEEYSKYFTASATVARKTLDFSTIDNVPQFVNGTFPLNGDRTPIYKYNDGWYVAQREGETPNDTKTITNSYCYYSGNEITINLNGEVIGSDGTSTLGDVNITSRNGLSFANSSEYTASFMFQVKYIPGTNNQYSNYVFYYGDDGETKYDNVTDDEKGISITSKQDNYFRLTKRWYIVIQTNMFVNATDNKPYLPVDGDFTYTDAVSVRSPKLLHTDDSATIEFAIDYQPVNANRATEIKSRTVMGAAAEDTLAYYVNSSMPAGTYTLRLYGSEVGDKQAISGEYTINVLPKQFDEDTIADIHEAVRGKLTNESAATEIKKYVNAYPLNDKKLHESIATLLGKLNDTLASDRAQGNYWSAAARDGYFDTAVTVAYNLEGSGNTVYMSENYVLGSLATAETYTFYYSISAKNYAAIGGADAADRRDYGFRTTLYTGVELTDIYNMIINASNPYFKDVTYTGSQVYTSVPDNRYYGYSFDDKTEGGEADYINVRENASVTLTLYDSDLSRWSQELPKDVTFDDYFALSADGKSLKVYFDITPATNTWSVAPQMPPWTYKGFNRDVNFVTYGLAFPGATTYYRIGVKNANGSITWKSVGGTLKINGDTAPEYFAVDDNGKIVDDDDGTVAAALNTLEVGTYYINGYICAIANVNAHIMRDEGSSEIYVLKATNGWKTAAQITGWTYGAFDASLFAEGEANFGEPVYTIQNVDGNGNIVAGNVEGCKRLSKSALLQKLNTLGAGKYNLCYEVLDGDNFFAAQAQNFRFTVSQELFWQTELQAATWSWGDFASVADSIVLPVANDGNNTIVFTVDGGDTFRNISASEHSGDSAAAFAYLKANCLSTLGVGSYALTASIAGTDQHNELSATVILTVTRASNSWTVDLDISDWTWNDVESNIDTGLVFPIAEQGTSALVTVTVKTSGEVAFEATVNYLADRTVNANDLAALERRLKALNVVAGGYTVTVTVGDTDSYAALNGANAQTADFVIEQATNSWATNGEPTISGWDFGGSTAYPTATPVFGKNNVVFAYADTSDADEFENGERVKPAASAVWSSAPSYEAGEYWLRATVPGTDNYTVLVGYHWFSINAARNDWVNMPGVVEWSWNGYDASVNLFSGSARSNKPAKFSITFDDGSTNPVDGSKVGRELAVGDFKAVDGTTINTTTIAKLKQFTLSQNEMNLLAVSDEVAKLLNALRPGKYVLTVNVPGGESLDPMNGSTTFTVRKAENSWATDEEGKTLAPSVRDYAYGASSVVTGGTPTYGTTVSYRIALGDEYVSDVITDITALKTKLRTLNVGTYLLNAWVVAASTDPFNGLYSAGSPYQTSFEVSPATNYWNTAPKTAVSEYYAIIHGGSFNTATWLGEPTAVNGTPIYTIMSVNYSQMADPYNNYTDYVNAVKALDPGEYIVRVSVPAPASKNYLELRQDMALTINRYNSRFENLPSRLTGRWNQDADKKTATVLDSANIKAYSYKTVGETDVDIAELTGAVKYTLRGVQYDSFAALGAAVKELGRGSYQVTVEVIQTGDYEGLSAILQLDIAAGDNLWISGENAPAPEDSIIVKGDSNKAPVASWAWSTEVDWLGVKPLYGDTVVIRIVSQADASNVLKYFTVNTGEGFDSQREVVSAYISKLDVGSYIMIVTTPSGDNWNGIDDVAAASHSDDEITTRIVFNIVEAANDWKSKDLAPSFSGNNIKYESGVYKWAFGTAITPIAEARHGNVVIAYYNAEGTRLSGMPTAAGTYTAVFSVPKPASGNYAAIDGDKAVTLTFTVEGVVYEAFDVSLGVAGWVWNSYDRTVNQIKGKPVSGGNVHFEILDADGKVLIDKFELVDGNGKYNANFDKDVYVPTTVAAKLNALTKGTYTLRVHVDAKANYEAFKADATFNVTEATNTWEVTPKIASWFRGGWLESKNSPEAVSRYGAPVVVITSNASGETLYRAVYNEQTGEYNVSLNLLEPADAGWYTMSVSVDGCAGMYTALPTSVVQFQIFIQGSPDDKNFWEVTPGIEGWTATIDGKVTMPTGKPVRGKPYFVFYKAELDGEEYKLIEKVGAGVDSVTVKKGETYAQDFYIPMAPGTYFMYAYAKNAAVPGDTLDEDDSGRVMLIIRNRANSWEKAVSIPSRLYLGEQDSWADPVAKASLANSDVEYKFFDAATRKDLGTAIPTAAGKYVVVAYASNRYSLTIESEMEFEVMLSKNAWVDDTSPTIENWSEEFSATSPDPVGEAVVGTIVYTYVDKADPGTEHTEKPTAAGDYIMIARVEYDGYETLEAHYEFTIEPAFDSTLALIDIVLGIVACMLAIVVIIFAIRRYKENG